MSRVGRRDRIELTDQGLEEHLALGRVRHTPWSQVRRVVWTGPGRAEVHCADGHTVVLTGEPERLDEQMAAIRQTAAAVQARWRTHGVPAAVVSSWLGMQPGGEWRSVQSSAPVAPAAMLLLGGVVILTGQEFAAFGFLLAFPGALLLAAASDRGRWGVVRADGNRIVWEDGQTRNVVYWRELRAMEVTLGADGTAVVAHVVFKTLGGEARLSGDEDELRPLIRTAQQVLWARNATLTIGQLPVPDAALSPARLAGDDAERGLSQSERR